MRKTISKFFGFAALMVSTTVFTVAFTVGCSSNIASEGSAETEDKLSIVTTIFPEYDWVREIVGEDAENIELTMLLASGVDLHSYQPTVDDIVKISSCDIFIYVGGESDAWIEDALAEAVNKDMTVINLLDVLGDSVKEEELAEGMESEDGEDDEEAEYDEHVWLSLKNAQVICQYIYERLCEIDSENADVYRANVAFYLEQLGALDSQYEAVVGEAKRDTLLFADRFPFRYMTDDYGLSYYAAFAGCSAETEASFETIAFLAGKVDELGLDTVLTVDGSDGRIAQTVIDAADRENVQTLSLDSMQSVSLKRAEEGTTYLSIMESNLDVLSQALN